MTRNKLESQFQAELIQDLKDLFPDSFILKNDSGYLQGVPDLIVLNGEQWAALEVKASANSKKQPNQDYYVELLDEMSYSAFVFPENKERVLQDLLSIFA